MPRSLPNIIITGTPGVGKTTTAEQLVTLSATATTLPKPLRHVSVNEIARRHELYASYDDRLETHVLDEDRLLDHIEAVVEDGEGEGGWVIDHHVCDIFPERWIDLVVVLRCSDTRVFYERLQGRGYGEEKTQENIDAEIFGVIADEARDGYTALTSAGALVELESSELDQVDENCERILDWIASWIEERKHEHEGDQEEDG